MDAAQGRFFLGQVVQCGLQCFLGGKQLVGVGRRDGSADVGQKFKCAADVACTFDFEKALFVLRIQSGGRVYEDAGAGGEWQTRVTRNVEPVRLVDGFTYQPRAEADDVVGAAILFGEPFEVKPLVPLVRHDETAHCWIAAHECLEEAVHAGGLAGAGVAGKEEVAIGLVARPSKTGKREHDLPAVRNDLPVWVMHPPPMIREVEQQSREHAKGGPDDEIIRSRQAPRAKHAGRGNDQGERQRTRSAQTRLIVAKIPLDKPARHAEENTRNNERGDRDGVRILQPLADQNVGCRESFHRVSMS